MKSCIFCRIVSGEQPVPLLFNGENVLAFADINPQAPTHILIIPKKHFAHLGEMKPHDMGVFQEMFEVARLLAAKVGVDEKGYRLALNVNREGGQSVFHVHMHLLGGKQMGPSLVG
jgi:histidine triad (HIT) family protein